MTPGRRDCFGNEKATSQRHLLFCHREERSDEAVSGPQEMGLLRKRNSELASDKGKRTKRQPRSDRERDEKTNSQ